MGSFIQKTFQLKGMTCAGCEAKVERILMKISGVKQARASFTGNTVTVEYDPAVAGVLVMHEALAKAGYGLNNGKPAPKQAESKRTDGNKTLRAGQLIGVAVVLFALYFIIENTIGFNFIPEVNASMGYGMLFVVGLLTSIHCVAMCGGINMSQCIAKPAQPKGPSGAARSVWPSVLYNGGRVISYTLVGGVAGAVGSVISFSGWARGVVAVLAGLFMVVMGVSMLGIFPWINKLVPRMPRFLQARAGEAKQGKGPFAVGLLNGLMPCGPLQAMQLYAMGTGSFVTGALSMLLFSLGTVPLMFGLGALSSMLSGKFTARMMKVSAALVLVLGLVMMNRGLALSGVTLLPQGGVQPQAQTTATAGPAASAAVTDGVQQVTSRLTGRGYPKITVQAGIPVRWNLQAEAKYLNGCNRAIVIPEFDMQVNLKAGDNIIEFTPEKEGVISYSCWMGMIPGTINVVQASAAPAAETYGAQPASSVDPGPVPADGPAGCCG